MVEVLRFHDTSRAAPPPSALRDADRIHPAVPAFDPLAVLLAETAIGHERAFARLYELVAGRLFSIARRIVGRDDLAEDVVQETFLRIWRAAHQYDPAKGPAYAWLVRIARNRALSARARGSRHDEGRAELDAERLAYDGPDPAALTMRSEEARRVNACLSNLPANHRRSVTLVYFEGLTHRELAERLGVQLGTAKSWVRRGLAQMSKCLLKDSLGGRLALVAADYAVGSLQGTARRGFERRRERDARFCRVTDLWEDQLALLTEFLPDRPFASRRVWNGIQREIGHGRQSRIYPRAWYGLAVVAALAMIFLR